MLVELAIRNFAIIDAVRIPFAPGLNVMTGETGAGKSILIDALGAVLGDRVSADLVRTGVRAAAIDATFELACMPNREQLIRAMAELEIESDDGLLILSREIQSNGRSVARLNGRPTTVSILAQIGAQVVDVHGQSEHLSLLRPAMQLELLDRFAGVVSDRERFRDRLESLRQARRALADVLAGARDRMQRVDLLRFQVEEIQQANLHPGEEEALASERSRLVNAERLARDAAIIYDAISGLESGDERGGAMPALRQAALVATEMASLDAETRSLGERVNEVVFLLEDIAAEVRGYRDAIEADPVRLLAVEERLAAVRQLKRKYGADIEEILAHGRAAEAELERLSGSEGDAGTLAAREEELAREVGQLAAALSARRSAAAVELAAGVERAITELNMGAAAFAVSLDRVEDPNGVPVPGDGDEARRFAVDGSGVDRVTFLIAPNVGEGMKALGKIASGGETARLMLALKSILSEVDETPTLVFDEIDVGVGGRSGQVVGGKLWGLAQGHQVIAITHMPQIAAFADAHFRISKHEEDGRVVSTVDELDEPGRDEELAAMLDGVPVTATSLRSAREMRQRARAAKRLGQRSA